MAQRILIIEKTWLQKWNFKIKFQYDSIPSNSIFKRVGMVTACLHFKARHILQSASCRLHQSFCHFSPVNLLILVLKSRMVCSIWNFGMAGCAEKCQGKAYQGWASSECPKKRSALPLARTLRKLQWVCPVTWMKCGWKTAEINGANLHFWHSEVETRVNNPKSANISNESLSNLTAAFMLDSAPTRAQVLLTRISFLRRAYAGLRAPQFCLRQTLTRGPLLNMNTRV